MVEYEKIKPGDIVYHIGDKELWDGQERGVVYFGKIIRAGMGNLYVNKNNSHAMKSMPAAYVNFSGKRWWVRVEELYSSVPNKKTKGPKVCSYNEGIV